MKSSRHAPATAPITNQDMWRKLLNRLYLDGEDELFEWAKAVRTGVSGERDLEPIYWEERAACARW